jgi:hypothetical protein
VPANRELTREEELWAAIMKADITPSDFRVYVTLLKKANFGTAEIPPAFQPRSLERLAAWSFVSLASVKRSVGHLQRHGWLERDRHITAAGIGGRGHPTHYRLLTGRGCDCQKAAQCEPVRRKKVAQPDTVKGPITPPVTAGQTPVSDERDAARGKVERGMPETCIGCGKKPRRGCRTCWGCSALEISDGRLSA